MGRYGGDVVEQWNFYFERCHGVTTPGATVALPQGLGIVTFGSEEDGREHVLFPDGQLEFDLIPGEVERLTKLGLVKRHGRLR